MDLRDQKRLISVAAGKEAPDLVLKGGRMVNVFTREIIETDIAICNGIIAGLGNYDGPAVEDVSDAVICPGFIDGHFHLESTMLTPRELAMAVIPHGTTGIVADPHEIANVMGKEGIRMLLDAAAGLPLDIYFMLPSCVPATDMETSGARLTGSDLRTFKRNPKILGLAEVMNYPGVIGGDEELLAKLADFSDSVIDGHAPLLSGKPLNAYRAAGILSDHECTQIEEAREKLRLGMHIMIREGTLAKNMHALLPLVTPLTAPHFSLVTDDLHPSDLLDYGHLDHLLNQAVEAGLDPITALMMVTDNTARYFGLKDRGAIAPGFKADLVILSSLKPLAVQSVIKEGRTVFAEGRKVTPEQGSMKFPLHRHFMNIRAWEAEALAIPWQRRDIRVIDLMPGQLLTGEIRMNVPSFKGLVVSDVQRDLLKIAVIERHRGSGNIGLGMVRGFGLKGGAIASSVAHDSHNIVCVGTTDKDIYAAAKEVEAMQGGMTVVDGGQVKASLPLPLGGLISLEPLSEVAGRWRELKQAAKDLGCTLDEPFMTLSFLALPVIPDLKITDRGLVDVQRFQHVPLFIEGDENPL